MNIEVITSFNQTYYDRIGRDCVATYLDTWSTPITVYAEDCIVPADPRVRVITFDQLGDDYQRCQEDPQLSRRCKTFAKKAFCVIHAMTHSTADWMVWLDADVISKRSDPVQVLAQIFRSNILAVYLGVTYHDHVPTDKYGNWLVPETGFFAINLHHSAFPTLRDEYTRRYLQRDFADLRRSYDNDVFGAAIRHTPAEYLDLCSGLDKPYKTPLKHTVLGDYLVHHKAKHSKQNYEAAAQ